MALARVGDLVGNTPLVRLRSVEVPGGDRVFGKCEFMNPAGSVKDRLAVALIDDGEKRGVLGPGMTLIEATAGNTGLALAMMCAERGYQLVCVMPEKMAVDKRIALTSMGVEVIVTENAPLSSPNNFRSLARTMAAQRGWFDTRQFDNPANPRVHEETTGPEILRALGDAPGVFVAGAGTGGTITGVGRALKRASNQVAVILADPAGSALAQWVKTGTPGESGSYDVEGIGGSHPPTNLDRSVIDDAEVVSDADAYAMARHLWRKEGLLVGGSAGANVVAASRVAAAGTCGDVVTILCDLRDRYWSKPWTRVAD